MADNKSDQERTEEPTQRKLDQAREDGNVSLSKEVSSVLLMVGALIMFVATGKYMYGSMESLFDAFLLNSYSALEDQAHAMEYLKMAMWYGFEMLAPMLTMLLVIALMVNLLQTGGAFSLKSIQPKGSKMSPASGLKRIFSMKGLMELVKGLLKLIIVGLIAYYSVNNEINHFVSFIVLPIDESIGETGSYLLMFVGRILAALFFLSIIDAAYQRYQHHKDLRMTKQEVKDEFKQMEGDPHVKSQRKKFGMQLRQKKRLDHAVLGSDVVVTNPIHFAVALRYDPGQNDAPIVMAKGQRLKAQKIKDLAHKYGIPIVENVPVARALFASAEEDEHIPSDLYRAVAEILAYVYKLKNKHKI